MLRGTVCQFWLPSLEISHLSDDYDGIESAPGTGCCVGARSALAEVEVGRPEELASIRRCCRLGPAPPVRGCRKGWMGLLAVCLGGTGGFEALTGSCAEGCGAADDGPASSTPPAI